MPTFEQLPGELSLSFVRGDDFSCLVDFTIALTGYTVTSSITSLITGLEIVSPTTTVTNAANGQVTVSLTDTQTAALPRGTYGWSMEWVAAGTTRTALSGYVEVV